MTDVVDLDGFDRHILKLLQTDAGLSTTHIASQVGLSQAPCWRRIRRLEEIGVIRGRVALLDRHRIGLKVMVMTQVTLDTHGSEALTKFESAVTRFPEVLECYTLLGSTDYLMKIVVPDIETYESFIRRLLTMFNIKATNSMIVVSEVKSHSDLPLEID